MSLRRGAGDINAYLEVYLYRNRFQLVTTDAMYSDGDKYLPAVAAINDLVAVMPSVSNVLVMGTGLGSMVHVVRNKGYDPAFTLVEIDKTVLQWALEFMGDDKVKKITPVCSDAATFIAQNKTKYDLIFVDIFNGRVVPDFVTDAAFLLQCRDSMAPGGRLVFNYIINNNDDWETVHQRFSDIFPACHVLKMNINRLLIS